MPTPALSIITTALNNDRAPLIRRLIGIREQQCAIPVEIIVTLPSTQAYALPGITELCNHFQARCLVSEHEAGAIVRLCGLREATGIYVSFWPLEPEYLENAAQALWGAASGFDIGCQRATRVLRTEDHFAICQSTGNLQAAPIPWFYGAMAIRRTLALEVPCDSGTALRAWFQALYQQQPTQNCQETPICWLI
jgi:hypothetical protein